MTGWAITVLNFGTRCLTDGPAGMNEEVTFTDLDSAISGTSTNSNSVSTLAISISDPPLQWEVQMIVDKLDELISALRR